MPAIALVDTLAHIETPENVRLSFRLAGPATRMGAYLVDLMIRGTLLTALSVLVGLLFPLFHVSGLPIGVLLLGVFFLEWGYAFVFEAYWNGQTPGKRALGLRVVKTGGYAISFYDAMLRNLLRVADALPLLYGIGLLAMMTNERLQRIGDLVAGTMVVRDRRQSLQSGLEILRNVEALGSDVLERPFRPAERTLDVIETFSLRKRELTEARANEIATVLAAPLAERLGYRISGRERPIPPADFLLRLLKTFHHPSRRADDRGVSRAS